MERKEGVSKGHPLFARSGPAPSGPTTKQSPKYEMQNHDPVGSYDEALAAAEQAIPTYKMRSPREPGCPLRHDLTNTHR